MTNRPHIHDDGLSPAVRAALAALRAEDELAAGVKDRMWSRLAAAAAADDLPDMSQSACPKDQARRRGVLVGLAIAAALTLTVLGLQHAARPVARAEHGEAAAYGGSGAAERATQPTGGAPTPSTARTTAPVPEDMSPTTARDDEPRPGAPSRRRPLDDRPAADASASALAAEAALLQRAQTALAADDAAAALALLEQHAREYAGGVLAQERAALRVVALCTAGREHEGRAEAANFLRAHAGSVHAERVRSACKSD